MLHLALEWMSRIVFWKFWKWIVKKITVFWDVASCSVIEIGQRFRGTVCRHLQGAITLFEHKVNRRVDITNFLCWKMHEWLWCSTLRFRLSWISNICSSVTAENQTCVYMTFLAGNDLRNMILKYWRHAILHPVWRLNKRFVHHENLQKVLFLGFQTNLSR
jgi:hypothetical protein